jgi:hypothetical protein
MTKIRKKIENGYIEFSDDIKKNSRIVCRVGYGRTKSWGSSILVYDTLKYIEKVYFDFKDHKLSLNHIKAGDVINLRNELQICSINSLVFDAFFLVLEITENEILLESYLKLAKAVKGQRVKSISYGFLPIPNKSKWKKYEKHK